MSPVYLVAAALIVLIGLGVLLNGLRLRARRQASAAWPSVLGRALSAEIKKQVVSSGGKSHTRHTYYRPVVEYEYTVDGVRYESDRVAFGNVIKNTEAEVQQLLEQTMEGSALRVFYNPQKPKDAVLLNQETSGAVGGIVAGAIVIALGIVMGVLFALR